MMMTLARSDEADYDHRSEYTSSDENQPDVVLMPRRKANSFNNVEKLTVLLVGNSNAGKSTFINWLKEREFKENLRTTLGFVPSLIGAKVRSQHYIVTLLDTAGTERFHSVPPNWYRKADGVIVMYDLTDLNSFEHVTTWKHNVEKNCEKDNIPYILVGNKVDKKCAHIDGSQVVKDFDMKDYFKTSAVTGEGVDAAINSIISLAAETLSNNTKLGTLSLTLHKTKAKRFLQLC